MSEIFQIKITRAAEKDLNDIWDYISIDSVLSASKFIALLNQRINGLQYYPERCAVIGESDKTKKEIIYRHLIVGGYRVIFRVDARIVFVVRILHCARSVKKVIQGRFMLHERQVIYG